MTKVKFSSGADSPQTVWSINLNSVKFYLGLAALFLGVAMPLGGFLQWAKADICRTAEAAMSSVLAEELKPGGAISGAIAGTIRDHEVRAEMSYQRDMQNVALRLQRIEILLDHLYEIRDLPRPALPNQVEPYGGHLILNGGAKKP